LRNRFFDGLILGCIFFTSHIILAASPVSANDSSPNSTADYHAVPKQGTVMVRPTAAEKDVPKRFRIRDPKRFQYHANYSRTSGPVRVYNVRFPSQVTTDVTVNNTVYGDYFQPAGKGPFPGVVVLHILGGEFSMSRMIANGLARDGVAALFIKLPYYGERRQGTRRRFVSFEPKDTLTRFTQGVLISAGLRPGWATVLKWTTTVWD
jgi:hypothetical protein